MLIDTRNTFSIAEASKDFSRVTKLVDECGAAVITKDNTSKYVVLEYNQDELEKIMADAEVLMASKRLLDQNQTAYEALAK